MRDLQFVLYAKQINNYVNGYRHDSEANILELFTQKELGDINEKMNDFHNSLPIDYSTIRSKLHVILKDAFRRYDIFNVETLSCSLTSSTHVYYNKLTVAIDFNGNSSAINMFKLKNPKLYSLMN